VFQARPQQAADSSANNPRGDSYEYKGSPVFDYGGSNNVPVIPKPLSFETVLGQLIKGGNSKEWILLQYLAWLDKDFTSEKLLLALVVNDQAKLWKAIGHLEKLSFVSAITRGGVRGLTIHPEIQNQIVEYIINNPEVSKQTSQLLVDLSAVLNKFLPALVHNPDDTWVLARAYTPTIEAIFVHSVNRGIQLPENKDLASLNAKLGEIYEEIFVDAKKGLAYQEKALAMYQDLYEGNHFEVAWSLGNVGYAYQTLGDVEKGLDYYERALAMYQAIHEGNHPDVANCLNNMGYAYQILGDVKKGLDYYKRALAIRSRLPRESPCNEADSL
jgi:tetratricopeptide (TPR) repeat protein